MKKILGVSLVALMAVSTARADIVSKSYVDVDQSKTYNVITKTAKTGAQIEELDTKFGAIPADKTVAQYIADSVDGVGSTTLTGYSKGSSADPVAATDTLNAAVSKLENQIDGKANAASITGAQKTKITYNNQGIVTAGDDLAITDIPSGLVVGTAPISASRDSSTGVVTVSAAAATDAAAGVIKIADATDIQNNSTTTAVTPAQLAAAADTTALAGRVSDIEAYSTAYQSGITSALVTQIGTNQSDIATLNGDASTTGSVAKSIADAIDDLDLDTTYAPIDVLNGVNSTAGTGDVANGNVVTQVTQSNGVVTVTHGNAIMETSATGTDGISVLTRTVDGTGAVTYKWETIQR